jgi:dTDP-4-amino-4,6-dideoxygalactose transaminase
LKLLYDAAHAFGVTVDGQPIGNFGDLSMFSFHATKLFHSVEGGMLTFRDAGLRRVFDYLKNFGFENETEVVMAGTNAKMNELQALMGILLLRRLSEMVEQRRSITETYRRLLADVPGIKQAEPAPSGVEYNYAYLPIEVDEENFGMSRDQLYIRLREWNVFARRYFYPLVPDFACYRGMAGRLELPVARKVSSRIITLPIYSGLALEDVERICGILGHLHREASARRVVVPVGLPGNAARAAARASEA